MKHSRNYSPKERKADSLWRRFNRKDQELFWQQYEVLLKTNQRKPKVGPTRPENASKPPKSSAQAYAPGQQIFKPTFFAYLIGTIGVVVFAAITIFFVRLFLQDDIAGGPSDFTQSLIALYLAITTGYVAFALRLNVFKIDKKYFYVCKPFLFLQFRRKWDNIQAIIIEKDLTGENQGWVSMSLSVLTHRQKLIKYKYQLSDTTHKKFKQHLESKIQDVRIRTKIFPQIHHTEHY